MAVYENTIDIDIANKRLYAWGDQGYPDQFQFSHRNKLVNINFIPLHQWEYIAAQIVASQNFYESPMLDYIADTYPEHGTIVDIGANLGNHHLYFQHFLKAKQYLAFEPMKDVFITLCKNTILPNATAFHYAIGEQTRSISIRRLSDNNSGINVVGEGNDATMIALDSFNLNDVTLMKVDVEGAELGVLFGAADTIKRCKPVIFMEDNPHVYSFPSRFLETLGYKRGNSFVFDTIWTTEWIA